MSKEQRTAKEQLLARVAAIRSKIEASADEDLATWAKKLDGEPANSALKSETDKAKAAEKAIVEKSTGVKVDVASEGQNARANANWPMDFKGRMKAASRMVKLARRDAKTAAIMLAMAQRINSKTAADDEEAEGDETCAGCKSASKLVKMAVRRTKSASRMMKMARKLTIKADDAEVDVEEDGGDMAACGSAKVASRLVTLAKQLMADEAPKKAGEIPEQFKKNTDKADGKDVAASLLALAKSLTSDDDADEDDETPKA
jgi:hypothetical protein